MDICSKFITPAIKQANWDDRQIREEVNLAKGRIIVKGSAASRGKPKRAQEKNMSLKTRTVSPPSRRNYAGETGLKTRKE